ncbi:hypothetical protein KIN20_004791 [Parelaphostrongylus tenuis]|uniref:SCP domain-containing protein n=1 Tax=Parelaphostrongylus tenuis TaxID=148309 RepID=A0AAD5QH26_PARTN|nr:hypothetical protein KIN20_004791 [Parelaphostrongylus tenuis]
MRDLYLKYHNDARSRLAKGKVRVSPIADLDQQKNIYKLSWSYELEKIAKELAQGCGYDFTRTDHMDKTERHSMVVIEYKHLTWKKHIKQALDKWWGKVKNSYVHQDNKYDPSLFEFSNFNSDCTIFPNSRCEDGLCVRPKEQVDSGTSQICGSNGVMTDAVRNDFLDMHNFYRSIVATGRAVDKIDKRAPKAAAMPKLKYSCELEQSATYHAGFCQFSHSQGNNATEGWFEELEDYGVGRANILTQQLFNRPGQIGHYTQLVWQGTRYVGCGIRDCQSSTLVVCQYYNAGNRFESKIYEIGRPCSKCAAEEQCTPTEGLCIGRA